MLCAGWSAIRPAAPWGRYASRPVGYKRGVDGVDNYLRRRSQGVGAVDNAVGKRLLFLVRDDLDVH